MLPCRWATSRKPSWTSWDSTRIFPGRSMFRVKENEERERIYRAFVGPQEDVEYLAPLYEYAVNGIQLGRHELARNGKGLLPEERNER